MHVHKTAAWWMEGCGAGCKASCSGVVAGMEGGMEGGMVVGEATVLMLEGEGLR